MYKAVIFDLNGVFLQGRYLSERFRERYHVAEDEFMAALKDVMGQVRKPNAPAAISLWKHYFKKWRLDLSETEFFDFWFLGERLVPELVDYASQLRDKGVRVFILSNNFKERTEYYRKNFPQIFSCVDKAYFSWETGFVKPSVEALNLVLSENNLQPSDCIYFDDSGENLRVAESMGIKAAKWLGLEAAKSAMLK